MLCCTFLRFEAVICWDWTGTSWLCRASGWVAGVLYMDWEWLMLASAFVELLVFGQRVWVCCLLFSFRRTSCVNNRIASCVRISSAQNVQCARQHGCASSLCCYVCRRFEYCSSFVSVWIVPRAYVDFTWHFVVDGWPIPMPAIKYVCLGRPL